MYRRTHSGYARLHFSHRHSLLLSITFFMHPAVGQAVYHSLSESLGVEWLVGGGVRGGGGGGGDG